MEIMVKWTVHGLEMAALATIVLGFGASATTSILAATRGVKSDRYVDLRRNVARTILIALELLIAADILRSLVLEQSLMSLAVLAALIGIRTFLSFSIDVELDGCWPWERARLRPCTTPEVQNLPFLRDEDKFRSQATVAPSRPPPLPRDYK
ncbi:DUF1622 domain-containing protein [Mesorhizobium sp. L-8-3]|uniref:DUF1622 domain-containing protein n=1 Tax=Mesorhizobium sp. L-8-3 TaxID=2744522 RepID=UPI001927E696|nr:DUF1622 domain-containing protein [Mesorhizobium sp. L-8-3]BCH25046.1 hypothetical protein MesoLjLb_48310 [Mesorhizobium sp. L-8-3]